MNQKQEKEVVLYRPSRRKKEGGLLAKNSKGAEEKRPSKLAPEEDKIACAMNTKT